MINKKKKKILNFQSFQTFFIFFLFLKQIKNFPISNIHCPLTLNLYLNHDHVFCSTNSINVIYYSSTIKLKISAIFDISLDKSCINIPLNPCFEGKKKKRNSVISKHYKDGGTRFVRGEIGLVKEFISLFSSNLLRIIKNKVKFIVKSIISFNGGSLLVVVVVPAPWWKLIRVYTRPHKVYLPTPLPSILRFTCCSPVTNKVCCIKSITWLLFNATPFFGKSLVVWMYRIREGLISNPSKILFFVWSSKIRLHRFSIKISKVVFVPLEWRSSCSIN